MNTLIGVAIVVFGLALVFPVIKSFFGSDKEDEFENYDDEEEDEEEEESK